MVLREIRPLPEAGCGRKVLKVVAGPSDCLFRGHNLMRRIGLKCFCGKGFARAFVCGRRYAVCVTSLRGRCTGL